ncbi:glucosaminidase domain-containing protein [Enterococcus sp. 669A]|uniref:Glucosaminidase domain-containing protein n=1 Tax=Candidatus Enterococcus moelleringii TaxID=2815325 RepID=A0ABS3LFY0_9ENTE|nr:glucosaminidase domain-containing protein [Enterococcus sp. 669A]MBO1308549.1 glucosaminidase domain-containing protein [Enterococcus sp. 669A]
MKGKALLVISCFLLTGYQPQVKQVLAETKESVEPQQETFQSEVSSSSPAPSLASSQPMEQSSVKESSVSSIKEEPTETSVASSSDESQSPAESTPAAEPPAQAVKEVIQPPATPAKVEENYQFSVVKNQTTEEFIQTIGKDAQQIAWDEDLYASVMIAQAILETGSGNSQLARPPYHNLFGIKGSYQGKQVNFNTQEDKGNGQLYTIQSNFRQYPSYKESLEDYAELLKNGLSGNPSFYQATWKENAATYQEATKALTGKYATDTSYDKKLNTLIETYELTNYDKEPKKQEETLDSKEQQSESSEAVPKTDESTQSTEETTQAQQAIVSKTKQQAVIIPPVTQRPAKQLSGNRPTQ